MGKRGEQRRQVAAQCAATAFASWPQQDCENLWSLCVFFETYIRDGGDATQTLFGPEEHTASVLRFVKPQH